MDSLHVALQRNICLMAVEATGVLEDRGNFLPRSQAFGLAGNRRLAPVRAYCPGQDRGEQTDDYDGGLSHRMLFIQHSRILKACRAPTDALVA